MTDKNLIGTNYMQVFKPKKTLFTPYKYFIYVDTVDDESFRIFNNSNLRVTRVESFNLVPVDSLSEEKVTYRFTTCKIANKVENVERFLECMSTLYRNQLLTIGTSYIEVCKSFHNWLHTETRFPDFSIDD